MLMKDKMSLTRVRNITPSHVNCGNSAF